MRAVPLVLAVLAVPLASCDGGPVDAAGTYALALTNRDNGCGFQSWTVGESSTNVPLTVTQSGEAATALIEGAAGAWVELILGSRAFTGTVHGHTLDLDLHGTRAGSQAGCTYTVVAHAHATLTGDVLAGTIDYTTATNGSPDCGALEGCVSSQDFNGTRPPQ
jgi:hypothetical protein